jgi:hypothetical protein
MFFRYDNGEPCHQNFFTVSGEAEAEAGQVLVGNPPAVQDIRV